MFAPYASRLWRAFFIATLLFSSSCSEFVVLSQTLESRSIEGRASIQPSQSQAQVDQLAEADRLDKQSQEMAEQGKINEAIPLMARAAKIREQVLGPEHREVAFTLGILASLYQKVGDTDRAEPLFQRALRIFEKTLGPNHLNVCLPLFSLAKLYAKKGDYASAEPLYQRGLKIREDKLGLDHVDVAPVLVELAGLYQDAQNYVRAEAPYLRALKIFEKTLGPDNKKVATLLFLIGKLYEDEGDYVRAEPLFRRGLAIFEKTLGADHPEVPLNLIAAFYSDKGDYAQAEQLLKRALAIRERTFGPDHYSVAYPLEPLSILYSKMGDYTRAELLYRRLLKILEAAHGPDDLHVGTVLNNLAQMYIKKGEYAHAKPLAERVLTIFEKVLGADHHDVATPLLKLSTIYAAQGDIRQALRILTRANDIYEHALAPIVATGAEKDKQLLLRRYAGSLNYTITFNVRSASQSPEATSIALTVILRRKGRALDTMTDQISALRKHLDPESNALLNKWKAVNSQLATLALEGPGQSSLGRQAEVAELESKKIQLESEMSSRSAEFHAQAQLVTLERVQRVIPPNTALVETVSYSTEDLSGKGSSRYAAYVLKREGAATFVDLGEATPINQVVVRLRAALADPKSTSVKQAARALDELVMRPVRKLLGETRAVLLSPDGELNLVPFATLVDEHGQYLLKNYTFTYLTSGRDLLRLDVPSQQRQPPLVIANPTFDLAVTTDAQEGAARGRRSLDFNTNKIEPLPGTAQEASAIKHIVPDARVLIEREATEAALKQVTGPRILHVATHGFFLKDQPPQAVTATQQLGVDEALRTAQGENPLLRSGLVLAGVKRGQSGAGEDGVLTALEASSLDLWGTKLVVLSACETGLGDVKNGEGVYGLRRALVLAGSETQVMSLWKVSDAGTRDLMVAYYTRLQKGEGRAEALRQVQLAMLQGKLLPSLGATSGRQKGRRRETGEVANVGLTKDYRHPYYWASFIPSGNWRNLAGQER
jgi:CHAT domain-containing protein/Tfp pilus assembly protein PilF